MNDMEFRDVNIRPNSHINDSINEKSMEAAAGTAKGPRILSANNSKVIASAQGSLEAGTSTLMAPD